MELTRKVRLKQGFSELHQDGRWYRPGDELGVTEATYQALRQRFDLIDTAAHVAAATAEDDMPEFPAETSIDDEDDAEEPKRRGRGRPAKKKQQEG
jgi:hypothetical protein